MLDRFELVLTQIATLVRSMMPSSTRWHQECERMIQQLVRLRGIGKQSATLLIT